MKISKELQSIASNLNKITRVLEPKEYHSGLVMIKDDMLGGITEVWFHISHDGWNALKQSDEYRSFLLKLKECKETDGCNIGKTSDADEPDVTIATLCDGRVEERNKESANDTFFDTVKNWDVWRDKNGLDRTLSLFEENNFTIGQVSDFIFKLSHMAKMLDMEKRKYEKQALDARPFRRDSNG